MHKPAKDDLYTYKFDATHTNKQNIQEENETKKRDESDQNTQRKIMPI